MSNKKQILYQADLAKVFGVCVKTFRKNLDTIISNNPNNPRIQRYIGKKWFLARNDLDEFLDLFSNKDLSKISDQSGSNITNEEKRYETYLELQAEYESDNWLQLQSDISRGK